MILSNSLTRICYALDSYTVLVDLIGLCHGVELALTRYLDDSMRLLAEEPTPPFTTHRAFWKVSKDRFAFCVGRHPHQMTVFVHVPGEVGRQFGIMLKGCWDPLGLHQVGKRRQVPNHLRPDGPVVLVIRCKPLEEEVSDSDRDVWRMDFSRFDQYEAAPPETDQVGEPGMPTGSGTRPCRRRFRSVPSSNAPFRK